jgi:hypothetical protein
MTQDYKKTLLDYITNLTPGAETTGEILQDINEVARSEWVNYLPPGWQTLTYMGIIKSKTSDVIVLYGGYVEYGGTQEDNSKGIITITDNMLKPIQTIFKFDSGTNLRPINCMLQEEDGQFVAIYSYTTYYGGDTHGRQTFYNAEKRFIMLNDISIPIDNVYYIKLRRSYILGNDYKNFLCRNMYKNPNSSHYFMAGTKFDTAGATHEANYSKIIDLKINVGSANEWSTDETGEKYINPETGETYISQQQFVEALQTSYDGILGELNSLIEQDTSFLNYYADAISKGSEEIEKYTVKMEHLSSVVDHYNNLVSLVHGENNYEALGVVLEAKTKTLRNELDVAYSEY